MTDKKYEILKKEVDFIKGQLSKKEKKWYKKISNIVAIAALLFSFGTTAISLYNSYLEDIRDNRREVRELIQRMTSLPIENYEFMLKYHDTEGETLTGLLKQENILLVNQAIDCIERYPKSFNATEYYSIANSLVAVGIFEKVPFFFEKAINKAATATMYINSTRGYAVYLYLIGNRDEGTNYYEFSLKTWDKFPTGNFAMKKSEEIITLISWSQSEANLGNIIGAKKKLSQAKEELLKYPEYPYKKILKNQIALTEKQIASIRKN